MPDKIRHGWFSLKAAYCISTTSANRENGTNVPAHSGYIYRTPLGKEVVVTTVTDTKDLDHYCWDDTVYVGEITDFVRWAPPLLEEVF